MDETTALYGGVAIALLVAALTSAYILLLLWTPPPIPSHPSEKRFRSLASPTMAVALPSLLDAPSLALTVVIPAYNETARLPAMLTAAVAYLSSSFPSLASSKPSLPNDTTNHTSKSAPDFEIVIVDDGSADGTAEKALELAGEHPGVEIRVVKLEQNLGKGGAVRHGMLHGRGKRLLMVDADGASRFEDLGLLWTALDTLAPQGEAGVAIGSRAHLVKTAAVVKRSFIRNFLMYGLHTVLRLVGVGHIRDTQCGFKLFTRAAAAQIFPRQHLTTWIFDVEVLLLAKQLGVPVVEVPIEWHEVPGSKLSVMRDSLQMLRDLLVLRANQLLGRWKLDLPENKPKSE